MIGSSSFFIRIFSMDSTINIFEGYFKVVDGYITDFYDATDLSENIYCGERDGGGGQDSRFNVTQMKFSERGTNIKSIPYFKQQGDKSNLFNLFDINYEGNYQGIDCFATGIKKVRFRITKLDI